MVITAKIERIRAAMPQKAIDLNSLTHGQGLLFFNTVPQMPQKILGFVVKLGLYPPTGGFISVYVRCECGGHDSDTAIEGMSKSGQLLGLSLEKEYSLTIV